jgi:hypothetical protein
MNRRILPFAAMAFAGLFFAAAPVCAQDAPDTPILPTPPAVATSTSQDYPQVSCTSADALAVVDTLQLATDTRDQLAPLLKLGPTWRFAVHIHIMTPDDPLIAKINREAAAVFSQGTTMKIEAVLPSSDPNAREFIQRQFVTALLWEKFFAGTTLFDKNTHLDEVPFWLVEGLRERLNEDPGHDRESIVKRAVKSQTAPTLTEITNWHELSDDRLLGLWQRAFCYYLADSLTQQGARLDDFQQWLAGFSGANSSSAQLHFPTEADWQRELVDASGRSHDIVYTWAETSSELMDAETITFAASKDAKVQTCTLDTVSTLPRTKAITEALHERIFVLTELELRAHPSWHSILEVYRSALTALVNDSNPDQAKSLLAEAHRQRIAETAYHQKLLDYVNWFEVTKDYADNTSHFNTYFTTAQEMERVEADPVHRNPIRAKLLQVESEL